MGMFNRIFAEIENVFAFSELIVNPQVPYTVKKFCFFTPAFLTYSLDPFHFKIRGP